MLTTVEAERCTILKTGRAVVRQLMTDPNNAAKVDAIDTSTLRCATFCAEPVSVEVHGTRTRTSRQLHQLVLGHRARRHGVQQGDVRRTISRQAPDTRAWRLPWVSVALDPSPATWSSPVRTRPSRSPSSETPESVNDPSWRGDLPSSSTYWPKNGGGFVQGDVARAAGEKGGAYTFHGRSDEVINVNGNRVGTEQIERCLWGVEAAADGVNDCAGWVPGAMNGDAKRRRRGRPPPRRRFVRRCDAPRRRG